MTAEDLAFVRACGQLLGDECADGFQHPRPGGSGVHVNEAVPGQRLTQLQGYVLLQVGDLGGGFDGPAVGEYRRNLKQRPLGVIEQAHAPLHRGPERVLPPGQIYRTGAQRVQRGGQPGEQRAGVQQPDAGGRELDRQGQALQATADLRHRRRVARGQGEIRPDRLGAVHEQGHGGPGRQLTGRHGRGVGRRARRQREHRILSFSSQSQHCPAGGQDHHAGTAGQQFAQVRGGPGHLLQVVEDEQPPFVGEPFGHCLQRRPGQVGAHRPAYAGQHLPRISDRRQRDEHSPLTEAVTQPFAHGHGEPGLADSTRTRQCHQPHPRPGQQAGHLTDRLLPPDQRGGAHRQRAKSTRSARRGPRRDAGGGEPLAQQRRQVIAHQPAEFSGPAEVAVGDGGLLPDAVQQPG